jgi:hypothetical protein
MLTSPGSVVKMHRLDPYVIMLGDGWLRRVTVWFRGCRVVPLP